MRLFIHGDVEAAYAVADIAYKQFSHHKLLHNVPFFRCSAVISGIVVWYTSYYGIESLVIEAFTPRYFLEVAEKEREKEQIAYVTVVMLRNLSEPIYSRIYVVTKKSGDIVISTTVPEGFSYLDPWNSINFRLFEPTGDLTTWNECKYTGLAQAESIAPTFVIAIPGINTVKIGISDTTVFAFSFSSCSYRTHNYIETRYTPVSQQTGVECSPVMESYSYERTVIVTPGHYEYTGEVICEWVTYPRLWWQSWMTGLPEYRRKPGTVSIADVYT